MPSRGGLPAPCITAIRNSLTRTLTNNIDTDALIDISINAPDCQLYFTTDGSKPVPFKRWMGSKEVTFKYKAPFSLKGGKRVVRAVAVSRDRLLESKVVSRTFIVRGDGYDGYDSSDSDMYHSSQEVSDIYWDTDTTDVSRGLRTHCRSWTDPRNVSSTRNRPASAEQGWIASTRRYPYLVETVGGEQTDKRPTIRIPEGPFNPVNYSGTQINVWGAPPGSVWPAPPGVGIQGGMATPAPDSLQSGLLTRRMVENTNATEDIPDDEKPLTVADVRRILAEEEANTSAQEQPEDHGQKTGVRSGNVSFSGLTRSGKALLSSYRSKKKK